MATAADMFARIKARAAKPEYMSYLDYLNECRNDSGLFATAAQRLLKAMGEPETVDSSAEARAARIFQNRKYKRFKKLADFYGIEDTVERVYDALRAASQGLEESRQIIYLLGPVGSAKSSLADRLKELMEEEPIYVLGIRADEKQKRSSGGEEYILSPVHESPLGLLPKRDRAIAESEYNIPARLLDGVHSPWAEKRLQEFEGDVSKFVVAKMYPSIIAQIAIAEVSPGDDNNQDISDLVGKVDVRRLEEFATHDPDAYSYSGGLCRSTQGILDFVEMFKAPLKTLHPLLTATQEKRYSGTENIGVMPHRGIILAHSNEAEWENFSTNKKNEAFLDRVKLIKVRYNLRSTEEQEIYRKMLGNSELSGIPIAPDSLELLARTVVSSRMRTTTKCKVFEKVSIYDGTDVHGEIPNAPTLHDLTEEAGMDEGMTGISTRFAFKILARAANTGDELGLDPIELLAVIKKDLRAEYGEDAKKALDFTDGQAKGWLFKRTGDRIRECLMENVDDYAQTRFERYYAQADVWNNPDVGVYQDPLTGQTMDMDALDKELKEIEGPANIQNAKDFRSNLVSWVLRYKASNGQRMPRWHEYKKMHDVIKKIVEKETEKQLPLLSFGPKGNKEQDAKHASFLERMKARGYTELQVRRIVHWYNNVRTAS